MINTKLPGYGHYKRKSSVCQTDDEGASKAHYCKEAATDSEELCITSRHAPEDLKCRAFKAAVDDIDDGEHIVVDTISGGSTYCFATKRPKPWCYVNIDLNEVKQPKLLKQDSWGYCGPECNLTGQKKHVLRSKDNVDVLETKLCQTFYNTKRLIVQPQTICIGKVKRFNFKAWNYDGSHYKQLTSREKDDVIHKDSRLTVDGYDNKYVTAAGTCNGDSGVIFLGETSPLADYFFCPSICDMSVCFILPQFNNYWK